MDFPVSGVHCYVWLPPAVAFVVALLATPAGISGAFLLLPFQMSVLGFVSPAVTPTNLIYNTVATPGGVYCFVRDGRMDWRLAWAVAAGTIPGVFAGAAIRIRYLPDPLYCKFFVGLVLLYLGARLLAEVVRPRAVAPGCLSYRPALVTLVALPVGVIGGIYGVGGGAIIAPFLMAIVHLPARIVAGPALLGTLITSIAGVAAFEVLRRTSFAGGASAAPDWSLGLLFGAGGLLGSYCGARLQKHLPERSIRLLLAMLILGIAFSYATQFIRAKDSSWRTHPRMQTAKPFAFIPITAGWPAREHSCLPCRDSSRHLSRRGKWGVGRIADAARTSASATNPRVVI